MAELSLKLDEIYLLRLDFCRMALMLIWTLWSHCDFLAEDNVLMMGAVSW
jgi:hypothetical protein